jgi:hypothetical protein
MIRAATLSIALVLGAAAHAQTDDANKETDCLYQGRVAGAVQKARLDGVREDKVTETILASNPEWPERFNNAIPLLAGQFYSLKKRELRKIDMELLMTQQCLETWDQVQEMRKAANN